MIVPLVTSVALTGVNAAGLLIVIAVVAAFLAHEPLLIVTGRRGARARRDHARSAVRLLAALGTVGGLAGGAAVVWLAPAARWCAAVPLIPAIVVCAAIAVGREKTWPAEIAVSLVFALATIPLCLAGSAGVATAVGVAWSFGVTFTLATLAVRVVILKARAERGVGSTAAVARRAVFVLAALSAAAGIVACTASALPWTALAATAPVTSVTAVLTWSPPPPARLRQAGWALVAASLGTAAILIAGFRIGPAA